MKYKTLVRFYESNHDNYLYEKGEEYPVKGYKSSKKRIKELTEKHPVYKRIFLLEVEGKKETKEEE